VTTHPTSAVAGRNGAPPLRLIAWELTRSCNLACRHCRAEAHPEAYPGELSTEEAKALIESFTECGNPIIILTGGEPLLRADVFALAEHARAVGLRCVMAPNGTLVDAEAARKIRAAGIARCSVSLDGADAASHDALRGVPGAFDAALRGIEHLKAQGVEFQINSTVTKSNLHSFRDIFALARSLGAAAWHIFLLVPTGRAAQLGEEVITAAEYEETLNWFYDFRKSAGMSLKATCAPHYHRILRQRAHAEGLKVTVDGFGMDAVSRGCLGGTGFCFIGHTGRVQPCGYLELDCGNIRDAAFPELWRSSKHFLELRDQSNYKGKCGSCGYHRVCGGCRARAYSLTGDHLAEEPLCIWRPERSATPETRSCADGVPPEARPEPPEATSAPLRGRGSMMPFRPLQKADATALRRPEQGTSPEDAGADGHREDAGAVKEAFGRCPERSSCGEQDLPDGLDGKKAFGLCPERSSSEEQDLPDGLDEADCRILDHIQTDFPLTSRPYAVIGERCGMGEEEAFRRVRALRECGLIRRLGAVFDAGRLGYSSALCAAKVPPDMLEDFTAEANAHTGVTHNYLRRHAYNVWFTCTAPSPEALDALIDGISRRTGIAVVRFPAERTYKIKVNFKMGRDDDP
jgi:heme b synthase